MKRFTEESGKEKKKNWSGKNVKTPVRVQCPRVKVYKLCQLVRTVTIKPISQILFGKH